MSAYEPPSEIDPVFNSLAFQAPNSVSITLAEANERYLARRDTATSTAILTSFAGDVTIGNSTLDYTAGNGLFIRTTANGEAMYLRTLSAAGGTLQKIELNPTHMLLFDAVRVTDSATPTNYSLLQQSAGGILTLDNVTNSSTTYLRNRTSGGLVRTPITLTSAGPVLTGEANIAGLNGIVLEGAMFGRNDTAANTFNGTLGYTRHPIGWTISATKNIAIPTSTVAIDVITQGTAITAFNTLSNGVWKIGCLCNNAPVLGNMSFVELRWNAPTGATVLNAAIGQIFHQISPAASLVNFSNSYPELLIRTTGNGTTALSCSFATTYSVQPTIQFNLYAIKVA